MQVNKFSDFTPDDGLETDDLEKTTKEELLNETFVVFDFAIRPSSFDEGAEYCAITVGQEDGPTHIWNTSAVAIRGALERMKQQDFFPCQVTLGQSKNKAGRDYLRFQ